MNKHLFEFSKPAEKEFINLSKSLQKRILEKLEFWESQDQPMFFAKKMAGLQDIWRFRVGDYRILVKQKTERSFLILLVLKIAHRREVY